MRNYAGHRLAPWLAHVMVSRQETARQLITPGEVMQLPPEQELILLAGFSPIRALKIRYFTDRNFTDRVMPPFDITPVSDGYPDALPPSLICNWYEPEGTARTRSVDASLKTTATGNRIAGSGKSHGAPAFGSRKGATENEKDQAGQPRDGKDAGSIRIGTMGAMTSAHGLSQTVEPGLGV